MQELKRRIREGEPIQIPQTSLPPTKKLPKIALKEEPTQSILANTDFGYESDDEEKPKPQSQIWNKDGDMKNKIDLGSASKTIEMLELTDEQYDWRDSSKKGVKSRKNFTDFLVENL